MMIPLILTIIAVVVALLAKKLTRKTSATGVSPFYLLSNNAHTKLLKFISKNKHIHSVEVRGANFVILTHPDSVKELVKNDVFEYYKVGSLPPNSSSGKLIMESVFAVNGDVWKHQRGIVNPAFTSDSMSKIIPIFTELSKQFIHLLAGKDKLDIRPVLQKFTLDALGAGSFGHSLGMMHHHFVSVISAIIYQKAFVELLAAPFHPAEFIFPYFDKIFKHRAALVEAVAEMSKITMENRKKELKEGVEEKFLLDILLKSDLTESEIKNNIWIFYLAGHETTATSLSWCFNYLAKHPEHQQTMYEEIMAHIGKDRDPNYEDIKKLTFMDMFIKEVLRIVPPFPLFTTRKSDKTTEIEGLIIPAKTKITTNILVIHHHPDFWPEPEKFDPYRFTAEKTQERHPFAYLPFNLGRRHCVGMNFSLLEQKILLTQVLIQYSILYVQDAVMVETRFLPPQSVWIALEKRI